ncbi:hypothetical protein [Streptomyces sp. NPDC086182]|uniref:hypothetical protein n=1 Tax=Streptomyces sp. NPDC086182 TaxID=3155058 RepID=UPI00344607B3
MSEQGADVRQFEVWAQLTKDAAMIGEWIGLYALDGVVITLTAAFPKRRRRSR